MNKILLIGCGYWGKNWYNTVKTSNYELVGVVDPNPVISVDVPLFNTIAEVNIVYTHAIIATNANLHKDLKNQLKCESMLIEKPCGTDETRTELFDCFPGFIFLSSVQFKYIKQLLDSKKLGDVLYSRFERASMGPRIRTDVSIIEDYAIHDLYIYQALFKPETYDVAGSLQKTFNKEIQPDTLFLTIKSDHTSTFFSSWRYHKKTRKIEICCEKGTIIWEDDNVYINRSHYQEIDGFDDFRNDGYKLTEVSTERLMLDDTTSNLHLQLDDFISGVDRTQIMKDVECFIRKIKTNLEN